MIESHELTGGTLLEYLCKRMHSVITGHVLETPRAGEDVGEKSAANLLLLILSLYLFRVFPKFSSTLLRL